MNAASAANAISQSQFWDRAAGNKVFSHPLDIARFLSEVTASEAVLDYGCGRGRLCDELAECGYRNLTDVDYSREMIDAAKHANPVLNFSVVDGATLPFPDARFGAVMLFAVLTCIADLNAQRALVIELGRVLKPGGLLLVSDYPLQTDARNVARYDAFAQELRDKGTSHPEDSHGVFRLPDGGLVRHHPREWFADLLGGFTTETVELDATTMNGNPANRSDLGTQDGIALAYGASLPC